MVLTPFLLFTAYVLFFFPLPLTVQVALVQTFQELFYFLHVGDSFLFVLPSLSPTLAVQVTLVQAFQELFNFLHCFFLLFVFVLSLGTIV